MNKAPILFRRAAAFLHWAAIRVFSYFSCALRFFIRALAQDARITTSSNKTTPQQRAGADVYFISQGRRSWAARNGKTSGIFKPAL